MTHWPILTRVYFQPYSLLQTPKLSRRRGVGGNLTGSWLYSVNQHCSPIMSAPLQYTCVLCSPVLQSSVFCCLRAYITPKISKRSKRIYFWSLCPDFSMLGVDVLLHNIWPFRAQGTVSDKQWCPLFTGSYGTRYPPGRLGWHFRWVWSRQGCPLESGWWTWSQTGWRHRPIAAKTSESVSHLAKAGGWGSYRMKRQTHQERFKRRLYFASEEVVPVYMPEEWMGLGNTHTEVRLGEFMTSELLSNDDL